MLVKMKGCFTDPSSAAFLGTLASGYSKSAAALECCTVVRRLPKLLHVPPPPKSAGKGKSVMLEIYPDHTAQKPFCTL